MSISTLWIYNIEELAGELFELIVEAGFKEMAETVTTEEMRDIIGFAAQVASNRAHKLPLTTYEYLERIRLRLRNSDAAWNEYLSEFIDEVYLGVAHEFPETVCDDLNFYEVVREASTLRLNLLVSERAISLMNINVVSIAELVY